LQAAPGAAAAGPACGGAGERPAATADRTAAESVPKGVQAARPDAHRALAPEASRRRDAAPVVPLLANHIGDAAVLATAIRLAREAVAMPAPPA
jgi:hypothetical protein